jgi:hypothetical protein
LIYFILAEEVNRIKIGHTRLDPDKRIDDMQIGSPVKLTRIALMDGDCKVEASIHRRFHEYLVRGEWFDAVPPLVEFIEDNACDWVAGQPNEFISESALKERGERKREVRRAYKESIAKSRREVSPEDMEAVRKCFDDDFDEKPFGPEPMPFRWNTWNADIQSTNS